METRNFSFINVQYVKETLPFSHGHEICMEYSVVSGVVDVRANESRNTRMRKLTVLFSPSF